MTDDERGAGRRSYDRDIDPVVETFVQKELTKTRHDLRGEFTVLAQGIERTLLDVRREQTEARLTSTQEHADVRADIAELRHCVEPIPALVKRVNTLGEHDIADQTRETTRDAVLARLDRNRRWMIGTAIALAALIVAAAGVLVNHS